MNDNALEANPFTERLNSDSGLDAVRILASSPAVQKTWTVLLFSLMSLSTWFIFG